MRKKQKQDFEIYVEDSGQNVPVIHTADIMTQQISKEGKCALQEHNTFKGKRLESTQETCGKKEGAPGEGIEYIYI